MKGTAGMELAAQHEKTIDATEAALRDGLRCVDATKLPSFARGHTRRGRVWFLALKALDCGPALEVVAIAPSLVDRVEGILATPDEDAAIERLARWCEHGGLDA